MWSLSEMSIRLPLLPMVHTTWWDAEMCCSEERWMAQAFRLLLTFWCVRRWWSWITMTTLAVRCQEEEMVQRLPQLKGLLPSSLGKTSYSEVGVSFNSSICCCSSFIILWMTLCWAPPEVCSPWLSFKTFTILYTSSSSQFYVYIAGCFSFFFPFFCRLVNTFF